MSAWGRAPRTVHGGWMHQNDVSMQTLDQLGISVEYSAIPGSRSPGSPTQDGSDFVEPLIGRFAHLMPITRLRQIIERVLLTQQ